MPLMCSDTAEGWETRLESEVSPSRLPNDPVSLGSSEQLNLSEFCWVSVRLL
jgi:hypothetical protein